METTCEDLGNLVLLTFWGRRLDVASKTDFTAAARESVLPDRRIYVLDLSNVTFVDSSGIGAIVGFMKHLGHNRRLELCGLSPSVRKVFRLTRLDKVFTIRDHREACLAEYAHSGLAAS